MQLIHDLLVAYTMPGIVLGYALGFFLIIVPERDGLQGYRMARQMMGLSQAFLFTFTLTTLIDVQFFTWRRFLREAVMVLVPVVAGFVVLFTCSDQCISTAFLLLSAFYIYKIVDYVIHFYRHYRDYKRHMSNYFSDGERLRLQWVARSFIVALALGILVLTYAFFPSTLTSMLIAIVMVAYYGAFGIRFINYAFTFHQIEEAMTEAIDADTETEAAIQKALTEVLTGRTSFVIAHRLSTIRSADIILLVDDGKIVERGTHDELMAAKGAYWRLYTRQYELDRTKETWNA